MRESLKTGKGGWEVNISYPSGVINHKKHMDVVNVSDQKYMYYSAGHPLKKQGK
jgi:hypothetical protein